jgi:TonB family protein
MLVNPKYIASSLVFHMLILSFAGIKTCDSEKKDVVYISLVPSPKLGPKGLSGTTKIGKRKPKHQKTQPKPKLKKPKKKQTRTKRRYKPEKAKTESRRYKEHPSVKEILKGVREEVKRDRGGIGMAGLGISIAGKVEVNPKIRAYLIQLESRVRENWELPKLLKEKAVDLECIISVSINRNGEVVSAYIESSSGDEVFDKWALFTIRKSQPLPPPPEVGFSGTMDIGFKFKGAEIW